MTTEEARQLLEKYLEGKCTRDEEAMLRSWYQQYEPHKLSLLSTDESEQQLDDIWQNIAIQTIDHKKRSIHLWPRIAAAASIAIALCIGGYYAFNKADKPMPIAQNQQHDVKPGGNKAILTLANGQKIILTGHATGKIVLQGNTQINQGANGLVSYTNNQPEKQQLFNTITTPRKGSYILMLSDGTEATLDASSSITFPVSFVGKMREVNITGQVYFKVKHNAGHPFEVHFRQQTVRDIGTEFNINAYEEEPVMQTTLVSGSIQYDHNLLNKAGQQVCVNNGNISTRTVDVDPVIAWKENYFHFDNEDLAGIMRKISRWYDVDIAFKTPVLKKVKFSGTISRFKNLSSVLHKLELTGGVQFEIKGTQVIIKEE